MGRQRKQYTGAFKAKIALEAIKGQRTVQELATAQASALTKNAPVTIG